MLSASTRLQIQEILIRIAKRESISLRERLYIEKHADSDPTVSTWVKKAYRIQQERHASNAIDHLLNSLDLDSPDPESNFHPEEDDLAEWFKGAPSWLSRS